MQKPATFTPAELAYLAGQLGEELAAAQGLLAAAGVSTRIDSDGGTDGTDGTEATDPGLSSDARQVLAWAVREGTTNLLKPAPPPSAGAPADGCRTPTSSS
jgi:hypothetical protein